MVVKKIVLGLLILTSSINADVFTKGKFGLGLTVGTSSSFNNIYTIVGLSANYFVFDNLDVGVGYKGWIGATPTKNEVSLSSNYYLPVSKKFRPCVGAFVRDTFVSGYDDYLSYGARGGLSLITKNTYVSLGYVYERYDKKVFGYEVDTSYPEFVVGLSF